MKRRRAAIILGLPTSTLVDAEPARRHVRTLQGQGMGWGRIASHAQVPEATVERLLYGCAQYGPSKQIHRDTARRLLAVRLDIADRAYCDGTGTRRRLRALASLGWTSQAMADRLGWELRNFSQVINNDSRGVTGATERKVRRLYDELWDQVPPQETPGKRGAVVRARNRAARNGWVSPLAWDDATIDDPKTRPQHRVRSREVAS
jgi:hypothetical protein